MNLGEEFGEPKTSLSWFIEQSRLGISSAGSLRQLMSSKVVDRQMPIYTVPVEDVALNDLLLYGPGLDRAAAWCCPKFCSGHHWPMAKEAWPLLLVM